MNETLLGPNNEVALPREVVRAAGLFPKDRISWSVQDGEIRGRKLDGPKFRSAQLRTDSETGLVYFESDVTPQEAEIAALSANIDRE